MSERVSLEAVVEEYLLARERGEQAALERLAASYPEHEHALTAYALLDAAVPTQPAGADLAAARAVLTPALKARALAAVFGTAEAAVQPIAGIMARAQELQLSGRDLASAVDLPRDVLLQLDRRLIRAASVPRRLLARLAENLQTSVDSIQMFLAGGPAARVAAYNFAPEAPRAGEVVSFAEAMGASDLATPEQRAAWEAAVREEGLD